MRTHRIIIIGAGFAGAASAYYLTLLGMHDVCVIESEQFPGMHASGRNAAMVRQVVSSSPVAEMAREGCSFIDHWSHQTDVPVFQRNGSLLLRSLISPDSLKNSIEESVRAGIKSQIIGHRDAVQRVPVLGQAAFDDAVWCPSDGVVDAAALLSHYLSEAKKRGARIITGMPVTGIEVLSNRVTAVRVGNQNFPCDVVVNAAGAWANEIASLAGSAQVPMKPYRRHLFMGSMREIDPTWPFVWDLTHQIYFRPESSGLLLSPCDESPHSPGLPLTDDSACDLLTLKVSRYLPKLSELTLSKSWAGLRTITDDGNFVIGWDPKVFGFFWVGGLGGHGVTCSASVGRLAAATLHGDLKLDHPFSPSRFITPLSIEV